MNYSNHTLVSLKAVIRNQESTIKMAQELGATCWPLVARLRAMQVEFERRAISAESAAAPTHQKTQLRI